MADKRHTTQLRIEAVDRFSKTVQSMGKVTGRFADKVKADLKGLQDIRGPLKMIEDFKTAQGTVRKSGEQLDKARERVRELLHEIKNTKNPTAEMRREFDKARVASDRLEERHNKHRKALNGLRSRLQEVGVDTSNLAGSERRLSDALAEGNKGFDRRVEHLKRVSQMQEHVAKSRKVMDDSLARAANTSFVGHASVSTGRRILGGVTDPIGEAKRFETAFADVKKVVDFESPEELEKMRDQIRALATDENIPMLAEDLAAIFAAGGQAGFDTNELAEFAELAAKVGVAFDITADRAGSSMADVKTAMGLTLDETSDLFNAINHLSNKSNARADKTLDFLNRAGADGANFGFNSNETLSFGAAMIASGAQADTAATSFRNMGRALTRGESATDRQAEAFSKLGLEAGNVAKDMQKNAVTTTLDVMERLNNLPKHVQASVMSDLFGDEARELTKLINNMDLQPMMMRFLADPKDYLGGDGVASSVEKEFQARSATTENSEKLLLNDWKDLKREIGEQVLPAYNEILTSAREILKATRDWVAEHPELTKWLVFGGVALGAMATAGGALLTAGAGLIGTLAVLRFGVAGLSAVAAFASVDLFRMGDSIGRLNRRRIRLGRPSFKPHLSDFRRFGASALDEVLDLERKHNRAMDRMSRRRSAARWGFLAGAGKFMLKGGAIGAGVVAGLGIKPVANAELRQDVAAPSQPEIDGMHKSDLAFVSALERVRASKQHGVLPTQKRIAALREDVSAYREEVEAAKAILADAPEFASGIINPQRVQAQANLDAAEAGLRSAQELLAETEAASSNLAEALRVLGGLEVAPVVDDASIDNALQKVQSLSNAVRSLPGANNATGLHHRSSQVLQGAAGAVGRVGAAASTIAAVSLPVAAAPVAGGNTVTIDKVNIEIPVPQNVAEPAAYATAVGRDLGQNLQSMLEAEFSG